MLMFHKFGNCTICFHLLPPLQISSFWYFWLGAIFEFWNCNAMGFWVYIGFDNQRSIHSHFFFSFSEERVIIYHFFSTLLAFIFSADSLHLFVMFFRNINFDFFGFFFLSKFLTLIFSTNYFHLFIGLFAPLFLILLFLCLSRFSQHKNDFFFVFLSKLLAFDVFVDSLHLFYAFFAPLILILLLFLFVTFIRNIKMIYFGFSYQSFLLLMFLLILFISFTVSVIHCSWYCCLCVCYVVSQHKNDFFFVFWSKLLAFDVSIDSFHLFYGFFAPLILILLLLCLLCFFAT